jgi:3-phenylpropionate/cinnamic acid dioxygenase small subunit
MLQELLDKQAVYENLMRYCRALDRMDRDGIKATYWPDSKDDHGAFIGGGHEWADEAVRWRNLTYSVNHHVSNVLIELDGNLARCESMFIVVCPYVDSGMTMFQAGRYRDLCEKRDGEWKILNRLCVWDWSEKRETRTGWDLTGHPRVTHWGAYFPDDPIYKDWASSDPTEYTRDDAVLR